MDDRRKELEMQIDLSEKLCAEGGDKMVINDRKRPEPISSKL